MRLPGYGKCFTLVNILPLILVLFSDIFFHSAVEAAFSPSILPFGVGEYFRNGAAVREAGRPLSNGIAPHKSSARSILAKVNKGLMFVVVALIITAMCIGAKPAIKAYKLQKFKEDLAKLKELARELRCQSLRYLEYYSLKASPEHSEVHQDAFNSAAVREYKDEFFRDTDDSEKEMKEEIWRLYLQPFLSACDLRLIRQTGRLARFMQMTLTNLGYKDEAFTNYDVHSKETPVIDENALSKLLDEMKEKESSRQDVLRVEYFLNTYKSFFSLRKIYMEAKEELLNFIKEYHKDVGRLEGEFAKKVNDESQK